MQRIFLTAEGFTELCAVSPRERATWSVNLKNFLLSEGKPTNLLQAVTAGDRNAFLLNLSPEYQALVRLLDSEDDPAWVWLGVANRTNMQALTRSVRLTWDGETAGVFYVEPGGTQVRDSKPFMGFPEPSLRALGVSESFMAQVRGIRTREDLVALEGDLSLRSYFRLMEIFDRVETVIENDVTLLTDKTSEKEARKIEHEIAENLEDVFHADRFALLETEKSLETLLNSNLPRWAMFPLPDQKKWFTRNFKGPVLIRGVAGSGKTALALLRARYLADEILQNSSEKILVATPFRHTAKFMSEDLQVIGSEYARQIEVQNIYSWASDYLKQLQMPTEVNNALVLELLMQAIDHCRQGMPNMNPSHLDFNFVRDEIASVIKGHNLHSQPDYLGLSRKGFGSPLSSEERRHLWRIYSKYQSLLAERNTMDQEDLLVQAARNIRKTPPKTSYAAIVLDDVQDIPPVALQAFQTLVKDKPNGLFLLSDITQKLTRSGEVLANLGIDECMRSPILRTNTKNSREIAQAGLAVLGMTRFEDLDGSPAVPAVHPETTRRGISPSVHMHETEEQEILWMIELIRELTSETYGYGLEDIAIAVRTNRYLTILELNLNQAQIPLVSFKKSGHDRSAGTVKVATYSDLKGMDFAVVILTEVSEGILPRIPPGIDAEEMAQHLSREQRLLYCGMSQAREMLYLSCYNQSPSRFVEPLFMKAEEATAAPESMEDRSQP